MAKWHKENNNSCQKSKAVETSDCTSLLEIATIENALGNVRNQILQKEREISSLKQSLADREEKYNKEKNEQHKQITDLQSTNVRLRRESCEQTDQLQNLNTDLSNVRREVAHQNQLISDQKKDFEKIKKERDRNITSLKNLEKENQDLLKRHDSDRTKLNKLREEHTSVNTEFDLCRKDLNTLKERIKICTRQECLLKSEITKLEAMDENSRAQIAKLEQQSKPEHKSINVYNDTKPSTELKTCNSKFNFGLHRDTFRIKERRILKDRIQDIEVKAQETEHLYSEQQNKYEVLEGRFNTQAANFKREEEMLYNTIETNKKEIEQLQKDIEIEKQNTTKAEKRETALTDMEKDNEMLRNALELITREYKSTEKKIKEKQKGNPRFYQVDELILMNKVKEICNSIPPARLQSMCNVSTTRNISVKNITVNHIYKNQEAANKTEEVQS